MTDRLTPTDPDDRAADPKPSPLRELLDLAERLAFNADRSARADMSGNRGKVETYDAAYRETYDRLREGLVAATVLTGTAAAIEALRQGGASVEEGRHWYRALGPDGSLWCETSNPREAIDSVRGCEGYTLERLPLYLVRTPWEPWESEKGTEEEAEENR